MNTSTLKNWRTLNADEEGLTNYDDDQLAISVHALAGYLNPQTMRVRGFTKSNR